MSCRTMIVILVSSVTCLAGNDAPFPSPVLPKSRPAAAALKKYDDAAEKAMKAYRKSMLAADQELDTALAGALKSAMANNDLPEANRINSERQQCSDRIKNELEIIAPKMSPSNGFIIASARYGTVTKSIDVTKFVAEHLSGGVLNVPDRLDIKNGTDPEPGAPKFVFLEIVVGGQKLGLMFRDADPFLIQVIPSKN